jgi:hypothetical protein
MGEGYGGRVEIRIDGLPVGYRAVPVPDRMEAWTAEGRVRRWIGASCGSTRRAGVLP